MAKHNRKGRDKTTESFVKLDRYVLRSEAYRHLEAYAAKLLTLMMCRYHGPATVEIVMGQRDAATELNCSQPTAARALKNLEAKGFIRTKQVGHFNIKNRHATTWTLTMLHFNHQPPTKDFMRWEPPKKKNQRKKLDPTAKISCTEAMQTRVLQ